MVLVDSHAHLDFTDYNEDLEMVLRRAAESGISKVLAVGCVDDENLGDDLITLSRKHSSRGLEILTSFGVHPHDASSWGPGMRERLIELCSLDSSVALGEIGLDFYYNHSPEQVQKDAFSEQLELAGQLQLPVIVHSRDAEAGTLEILERRFSGKKGEAKGVVHCFTGSKDMAMRVLDLGFHLGFGGIITFKNSSEMREIVAEVPLNRILLETDAPFLAPVPFRGKRNEPSYLGEVAKTIALVKNLTIDEVAEVTTNNFNGIFQGGSVTGKNE